MNTSSQTPENTENNHSRPWLVGAMLILIGMLFLVERLFNFPGWSILPSIAVVFLAWGLLSRETGLLIPGGILSGISAATILLDGPLSGLDNPAQGGTFFLAFAGGWVLISLLSIVTEPQHKPILWPLFPAAGMSLFAGLLLAGDAGQKFLDLLGQGWPVALIVVGLYLALRRKDLKD